MYSLGQVPLVSSIYGSSVEPVKTKGLVLGTIPSVSYKTLILDLQSGGLLLLMTDGIPNLGVPKVLCTKESGWSHRVVSGLSNELTWWRLRSFRSKKNTNQLSLLDVFHLLLSSWSRFRSRHLFDQLKSCDHEPGADWQDIPPTAAWLAKIYNGIEVDNIFLFVIRFWKGKLDAPTLRSNRRWRCGSTTAANNKALTSYL